MPKAIEMMKKREEELLKLISSIKEATRSFSRPKLLLIGGYALRAFIPYSRYTRDCDFALKKGKTWWIDKLKGLLAKELQVEALEKHETYGFLRLVKFVRYSKKE